MKNEKFLCPYWKKLDFNVECPFIGMYNFDEICPYLNCKCLAIHPSEEDF